MLIKFNDSGDVVGTFTFYQDPGHGWLKVPIELLERLGIAEDISTYSYRYQDYAYLEEDCDFTRFRVAMGKYGYNFRIRESVANKSSRIREYPYYCHEDYKARPMGEIGEVICLGAQKYVITNTLGRRGYNVRHIDGQFIYTVSNNQFNHAKSVAEE
jgi:hypothetical protein